MGNHIFTPIFEDTIGIEYCEWTPEFTHKCIAGINEKIETGFDVVSGFSYMLNVKVNYFDEAESGFIMFSLSEPLDSNNCKEIELMLRASGYKFIIPCAKVTKAKAIRAAIRYFDDMESHLKLMSPCSPLTVGKRKCAKLKGVAA